MESLCDFTVEITVGSPFQFPPTLLPAAFIVIPAQKEREQNPAPRNRAELGLAPSQPQTLSPFGK